MPFYSRAHNSCRSKSYHRRRVVTNQKLSYGKLEPRVLLAVDLSLPRVDVPRTLYDAVPDSSFAQTVVANYRDDFSGQNNTDSASRWKYYWNKPNGWEPNGSWGDQSTGSVHQLSSYRLLQYEGGRFDSNGGNGAAKHVSLTPRGGHPGKHAVGANAHDRFAIAAFKVPAEGYYSIVDTFLTKMRNGGDEIEVFVKVGNDDFKFFDFASPGSGYSIDFDVNLGFLRNSETIYVGVGAGDNHSQDGFEWDFSIVKVDATVVTDFRDDFRETPQAADNGWQYLWNAPTGWRAGTQTGNLYQGEIGNPDYYRPLFNPNNIWTPDGNRNFTDNYPASYMHLDSKSGHVGASLNGREDRYAIASYEFKHSGYYAIENSYIRSKTDKGNGVLLLVHNEAGELIRKASVSAGQTTGFNSPLGYFGKGERVFVAVGANGNHVGDSFAMDFSIVSEPTLRPEPLRTLGVPNQIFHVADFGAIPNDAIADDIAIQATIDAAILRQRQVGGVVQVRLEPGTYRISPEISKTYLEVRFAKNIQILGAGATKTELLITDARAPGFRIVGSQDVIFQGFSIDYETLPFTQGTVQEIDGRTIVVKVDNGYAAPNDSVLFGPGLTTHRSQFLSSSRSGILVEGGDFAKSILNLTEPLGGNRYELTFDRALPDGLRAGDAWYQIARADGRGNFSAYANKGHISVIGVHSFASPGGFIQGQGNEAINVIRSFVGLKDGRLVSHVSDSIHAQRNFVGPWVEDSFFIGVSDDAAHWYRFPTADLANQVRPNEFNIQSATDDLRAGDRLIFHRPGGYRFEANVTSRTANRIKVDRPVIGYTNDTLVDTVDQISQKAVFRDNVFGWMRAGRGALAVGSPHATIIGNRFTAINSRAIAADAYNSHSISDHLIVQGNTFRKTGFGNRVETVDLGNGSRDTYLLDNVFEDYYGTPVAGMESGSSSSANNLFADEFDES